MRKWVAAIFLIVATMGAAAAQDLSSDAKSFAYETIDFYDSD